MSSTIHKNNKSGYELLKILILICSLYEAVPIFVFYVIKNVHRNCRHTRILQKNKKIGNKSGEWHGPKVAIYDCPSGGLQFKSLSRL